MVANRGPLIGVAVLVAVLGVLVVVGGVLGVGPLASTTPADQVKDPREMIARSLQTVLDANAVRLDATVSGTIPGVLAGRPEQRVVLDGTAAQVDLRPRDARTGASVDSPPLGVALEIVTVWDGAWYRTPPDGPWSRASLGAAAADAGVDANPLTLVDRLRAWLARPELNPTATDVPCAGESGTCRHVVLEAGTDPAELLGALLPDDYEAALPDVTTTVTLDADTGTLRPVHLELDMRSEDGTVDLRLALDASRWDDPGIVIEEPPAGS
jgi:hypothetical protein